MEEKSEKSELTRFVVLLTVPEWQAVRHTAVDERCSASEIVRIAVSQFLARRANQKAPRPAA